MLCARSPLVVVLFLCGCASGEQVSASGSTTTGTTTATGETTTTSSGSETSGSESTEGMSESDATSEGPTDSDSTSTTDPDTTSTSDPTTGPVCVDMDMDGYGEDCELGPDCDDNDPNNYTPEGCENCIDNDEDNAWVNCDAYDDNKPGPDCDDSNVGVGAGDEVEMCNGIAENCAGEIDPLPADEMCPSGGGEAPNVAGENGWICNVTQIGVDGCEIANCEVGFYDANQVPADGCECVGTDRDKSLASCSQSPQGFLGDVGEGETLPPVAGVIPNLEAEDWFHVGFDVNNANGARPNAGSIQVSFSENSGNPDDPDYRFEVFRTCDGQAFADGLATEHSGDIEPALEWWFEDNHDDNAHYVDNISWPDLVFIRVFRVHNPGQCTPYELTIKRVAN